MFGVASSHQPTHFLTCQDMKLDNFRPVTWQKHIRWLLKLNFIHDMLSYYSGYTYK